jgi:pimeloyl-ACP methyl ester carboxylesterase
MSDFPIDRGFVRLDEGLVHYRERRGAPDPKQPPLLLLHASPASSRSLEPVMAAYPPGRRLLAPDTLGNGASVRPAPAQPEIADYADAMERFCDALDVAEVDVFGSHTGAHIALEMAARAGTRVRRVVLDGVLTLTAAEREEYLAQYAPPQQPDASGAQFHWAWQYIRDQMVFFPHFRKDSEHLRHGGVFDGRVLHELTLDILNSLETYHLAYEAVFRHDIAAALGNAKCPLLWLDNGETYLDAGKQLTLASAPHAKVAEIAHTPGAIAEAIEQFR